MKLTIAILVSMFIAPLAFAEKPTTQPMRSFFKGEGERRLNRMKPSQQEIDDTLAFVKQNFPNHYDLFSRISEGTPFYNMAVNKMVSRYRQLMRMKDMNPEVYDAMLKQSQAEDTALGFARDVAAHVADADSKLRDAAEVRLREEIRHMVDRSLAERRERIMRLRAQLDEQEKKLKEDEDNRDQVIASQVDRIKQEYERLAQGPHGKGTSEQPDAAAPEGKEIDASQK